LATWNQIETADKWYELSEVSKLLAYKQFGRTRLFALLRDQGILRPNNQPFQTPYVDKGYFKLHPEPYKDKLGRPGVYLKTVVSATGLEFIRSIIEAALIEEGDGDE
jgi:phage antirepressor YoqD-like protein